MTGREPDLARVPGPGGGDAPAPPPPSDDVPRGTALDQATAYARRGATPARLAAMDAAAGRASQSPQVAIERGLEEGHLDAWWASAADEVTLPSGRQVQLRRVPVDQLLYMPDVLRPELRVLALRFATTTIDAAALDEEGIRDLLELVDALIAAGVQAVRDGETGGEWEPLRMATEDVRRLPHDDAEALRRIATGRATPEGVTINSRVRLAQRTVAASQESTRG